MTLVLPNRPFADSIDWKSVNYTWWLKRIPLALLAIPSAWGVGAFAHSGNLPLPVAVIAGTAFEAVYLGAVAFADQQYEEEDTTTSVLWWLVNVFAVIASVVSNALFFSGGTYAAITAENLTHAIPLPVLGFFYGLLLHRMSTKEAKKIIAVDTKQREESERKALYAKNKCQWCSAVDSNHEGFKSSASLRGHYAKCPNRPKKGN